MSGVGNCVSHSLPAPQAIGGGVSTIQLLTGLAGAPAAPPVAGSAQNLAIDGAVLALMVFFYRRDEAAAQRQMARISREEALGALRVELAGGKCVKLSALRSFVRVVVAAGPAQHVAAAAAAAEPYRAQLQARGVLFVPVVTEGERLSPAVVLEAADKRWRADPLYLSDWMAWLNTQMGAAGVAKGAGVYLSLRLDGRVRASGLGAPPWELLASSLPPVDGVFAGFLDGARRPGRNTSARSLTICRHGWLRELGTVMDDIVTAALARRRTFPLIVMNNGDGWRVSFASFVMHVWKNRDWSHQTDAMPVSDGRLARPPAVHLPIALAAPGLYLTTCAEDGACSHFCGNSLVFPGKTKQAGKDSGHHSDTPSGKDPNRPPHT